MSFDTLKLSANTEKFVIARMAPARDISDDISLDTGTTYATTFAFSNVFQVIFYDDSANSTTNLTKVSGAPSSGQFSFNDSTKVITLNGGVSIGGNDKVIAYYYLYYSSGPTEVYYTPDNTATHLVPCNDRLSIGTSISHSISDFLNGTYSFSGSSLKIINPDYDFNKYVGDDDSFSNKAVNIYFGYDNIDNCSQVFTGTITSIALASEVSLSLTSDLSKLSTTYYTNGTYDASIYDNFGSGVYSNDQTRVVPRLFSQISHTEIIPFTNYYNLAGAPPSPMLGTGEGATLRAVALDDGTDNPIRTNHRVWGTVYGSATDGDLNDTVGPHVDQTPTHWDEVGFSASNAGLINYGDSVVIRGWETYVVGLTTVSGNPVMRVLKMPGSGSYQPITGATIFRAGINAITIIQNGRRYWAHRFSQLQSQFSVGTRSGTLGSENIRTIVFVNDFESTTATFDEEGNVIGYLDPISPENCEIYYRAYANTSLNTKHGDAVKTIVEAAGYTVNSASITQANTDLTDDIGLTYPNGADESPRTFLDILQELFSALLTYIVVNGDNEVEYKVIKALSPTITITENEILLGSFSVSIDYKDIFSTVEAINPDRNVATVGTAQAITASSLKAEFLHEVSKLRTIRDYSGEDVFTRLTRFASNVGLSGNRLALYNFQLAIRHDVYLGDQITLEHSGLLGSDSTRDLFVVGITKTAETISIEAVDLLGF